MAMCRHQRLWLSQGGGSRAAWLVVLELRVAACGGRPDDDLLYPNKAQSGRPSSGRWASRVTGDIAALPGYDLWAC